MKKTYEELEAENARHIAEVERLSRQEHSIKEALGLLAGGVGLPVSEHVRQVVDEKNHLEEKLAEVTAGCDLQRGDKVYRQVPVVIGPGKTQAELDLDAEKQKNARLQRRLNELEGRAEVDLPNPLEVDDYRKPHVCRGACIACGKDLRWVPAGAEPKVSV